MEFRRVLFRSQMTDFESLSLVDSHAHIQGKEYAGEVEAVIARACEAGIDKIIAVGGAGDLSSNHEAVALANLYDRSEERRVGKEWVSTCRSRWAPYH